MYLSASVDMKVQSIQIGEVDARFLLAVNRFGYLTAVQAARLFYPKMKPRDGQREAQRRMKRLSDTSFLLRLRDLEIPRYGSYPHIFTLGRRGRQYLTRRGITIPPYYRPSEQHDKAWNLPVIEHDLAVIDFVIAAERLTQESPAISLTNCLNATKLKRRRIRVEVVDPEGKEPSRRTTVVPDAWFQLELPDQEIVSIALELDRDSEEQAKWRHKVAALSAWAAGPYQEAFETDSLTIAVVTPTQRRRDELRRWTLAELTKRGLLDTDISSLFLFTDIDPVAALPQDVFSSPVWYEIQNPHPVALLELLPAPEGQAGNDLRQRFSVLS